MNVLEEIFVCKNADTFYVLNALLCTFQCHNPFFDAVTLFNKTVCQNLFTLHTTLFNFEERNTDQCIHTM